MSADARLLADEPSAMSTEDMADIIAFAANGHMVVLAGDQEQLGRAVST